MNVTRRALKYRGNVEYRFIIKTIYVQTDYSKLITIKVSSAMYNIWIDFK